MNWVRDMVWQNSDRRGEVSVAHQFARYALALDFDLLPANVVHQAKRCLLDALGCAVAGFETDGRRICQAVAEELGGRPEATVIGSGLRTNAVNATLVNCYMVRCLEWNDMGGGAHNTDAIPALLAVSERQHACGRDLLTSVVISYELGTRVRESAPGGIEFGLLKLHGRMSHGLGSPDTRAGLTMPPAVGKLLGLTEVEIANAIGTVASGNVVLDVVDTVGEEHTMRKNLRFGAIAKEAILACLMAQQGFTGPVRVVEGDFGWQDLLFQGELDLSRMTDFSGWRILDTRHKFLCANRTLQGQVNATLAIVKEHDLKPADIEAVHVSARQSSNGLWTPDVRFPRNAESAGDSPFFTNAFAIKERSCGPEALRPENFTDPVLLDLMERITPRSDSSMGRGEGTSVILTKDGRRFEKNVKIGHGFGDDPLSDAELEDKLKFAAGSHLSKQRVAQIIDTVWSVDQLEDVSTLMQLMVFD